MSEINDMVKDVHETAKEKGWWETDRDPLSVHMLIVSEVSEATECVRNGDLDFYVKNPETGLRHNILAFDGLQTGKPEGEAVELADAVIRIMDYFGRKGWDLDATLKAKIEYNRTRGYRHGGKKA